MLQRSNPLGGARRNQPLKLFGRGLKRRSLPQIPCPARRCKNAFTKADPCPKKLRHLLQSVEAFIEHYYNRCRLHSALGMNSAELERVIAGHDAVLSGFGPRVPISKGDANLLRNFAVALTSAMQHASVGRVVIESTAFLF